MFAVLQYSIGSGEAPPDGGSPALLARFTGSVLCHEMPFPMHREIHFFDDLSTVIRSAQPDEAFLRVWHSPGSAFPDWLTFHNSKSANFFKPGFD